MQKWLSIGSALILVTLVLPGVSAEHTGSRNYFPSAGARVNHGITGVIPQDRNGIAATSCSGLWSDLFDACIGGGFIFPSQYDSDNPDSNPAYLVMAMTVSDEVSGPNVYAAVCNYHPDGGTWCDDGQLDGNDDGSAPIACGVTLVADARGAHTGNTVAVGFTHNLWIDPATNEVCVGTAGSMNVVFSNP